MKLARLIRAIERAHFRSVLRELEREELSSAMEDAAHNSTDRTRELLT